MTVSISTIEDAGVLEVVYSPGQVTVQALAEQRDQVAEALSGTTIRRILIDATALERFPSIDVALEHSKGLAAHEVLRLARFAVLCASIGEDERGLENAGVNRDVDVKCFTSRDEALSWLQA